MQEIMTVSAITAVLVLSLCACSHPPPPAITVPDATRLDFGVEPVTTHVPAGPLNGRHTFGQTFIAHYDGLTKIEVLVATNRAALPGGELVLHLRSSPDQQKDIASATIPARAIKDNSYVTLEFAPISNSGGKSYYFYLEAREIPPKYALTLWRSTTSVYAPGRFYIGNRPQDQDAYFRVYYHASGPFSLENSLVAAKEEGRLYVIQNGKRRWIRDQPWLAAHGYASSAPIWLSLSELRQIPVGPAITYLRPVKKIRIAVFTALFFLFFFLTIYKRARLQWGVRQVSKLLGSKAFLVRQRVSEVLRSKAFLFAGFVLVMWMRGPSLVIHPRFWAEEGTSWFQYASTHSVVKDLFYIYPQSGYLNLMANIGGVLSSATARFFSVEYAPLATTVAAFLVQILAIGIILYGKSRLFSSRARAVCGCLIVLFAPTSISELWLNTINSMSYLGLITLLLLFEDVSAWPSWVKWAARAILVLCGLSAAYSIALLPLFVGSFLRYRERERKVQCFVLSGCLLIQIGCVMFSKLAGGGLPYRGTEVTADLSSVNVLFWHIAVPALGENVAHMLFGALGLPSAWLAASSYPHVWDPSVPVAGVLSCIIIVAVFWLLLRHADANKLFLGAAFLIFAVLTCIGSLHSIPATRYAFLPGLVFLFLLLSNIEPGRSQRVRSLICMLVLSFALANGVVWYHIRPEPNAPVWSQEVAKWRADHSYKPRIWPPWWSQPITLNSN